MDSWMIVAIIVVAVVALAWYFVPKFRAKASKYIDKDGDGRPFQ